MSRVVLVALLVAAGLVVYSQTQAFAWDEGFHVLAAQLIKHGKRPYLDFVFSQTPLNAYWNVFWMSTFGETWRAIHAVAAVCASVAVFLTGDHLYRRFPVEAWRLSAAIAAMLLMGLNVAVIQFGTIGQAYGFCLMLIVIGYRCAVETDRPHGLVLAAAAGLASGASADASLLTAPVMPVLLIWIWFVNRPLAYVRGSIPSRDREGAVSSEPGNPYGKCAAFVAGVAIAFVPLLRLLIASPRPVIFGILEYNGKYREVRWAGATEHNIGVMLAWIGSFSAVAIVLLAIAGVLFVKRWSDWEPRRKQEFYLCAWLAAALALHISVAKPTFERYYLFTTPFLAILGSAGLYWIASRLAPLRRPALSATILAVLLVVDVTRMAFEGREDFSWGDMEGVAQKVAQVTPAGTPFVADEQVYFLLRRTPPSGMELADSHKLDFPPEVALPLHVLPERELIRRIKAREFGTVELCDEGRIERFGLPDLYANKAELSDCYVYWNRTTNADR